MDEREKQEELEEREEALQELKEEREKEKGEERGKGKGKQVKKQSRKGLYIIGGIVAFFGLALVLTLLQQNQKGGSLPSPKVEGPPQAEQPQAVVEPPQAQFPPLVEQGPSTEQPQAEQLQAVVEPTQPQGVLPGQGGVFVPEQKPPSLGQGEVSKRQEVKKKEVVKEEYLLKKEVVEKDYWDFLERVEMKGGTEPKGTGTVTGAGNKERSRVEMEERNEKFEEGLDWIIIR